jgi:hypothetical protein
VAGKKHRVLSSDLIELDLTDEDLEGSFQMSRGLWLGRFTPEQLIADLEKCGVFSHLAQRGYTNIQPKVDCEGFESNLRITGDHPSKTEPQLLVEVHARLTNNKILSQLDDRSYSSLVLDWVLFQDPCAQFDAAHPQLPGQEHPGLDILHLGTHLVLEHVSQLQVELVINHPQHFHNAVFYSPEYRFVDPLSEGHFLALKRDLLAERTLAFASEALNRGAVLDEAGHPVLWKQNVQAWPRNEEIEQRLFGPAYLQRVELASRQTFRYADKAQIPSPS